MTEPTDLETQPPAEADPTTPTLEAAMLRLRIDDDLSEDVKAAIPQAKSEAEAFLDGTLYANAQAREAAADIKGIICTPSIIAAQLLLIDVLVGANDLKAQQTKREAAYSMLRRHRNMGV